MHPFLIAILYKGFQELSSRQRTEKQTNNLPDKLKKNNYYSYSLNMPTQIPSKKESFSHNNIEITDQIHMEHQPSDDFKYTLQMQSFQ